MIKTQSGFSVIEGLLIVAIIGILGGVGWFVYNSNKKADESFNQADSQKVANIKEQETKKPEIETKEDNLTKSPYINEVDITLKSLNDISKLPEYAPASFKTYLSEILKNNGYSSNNETIVEYQISRISKVNIQGGGVDLDKNGSYAGGAPIIWVLTPNGTWDEETLNGPVCKSKYGGLIYEEFAKECFAGSNNESWVKNPNGSISKLNN